MRDDKELASLNATQTEADHGTDRASWAFNDSANENSGLTFHRVAEKIRFQARSQAASSNGL